MTNYNICIYFVKISDMDWKETLEKPEGTIENEQSKDTGNI